MFVTGNEQQERIFSSVTTPLGDELKWRWEDKMSALLAEFSWEKKERILKQLRQLFSDEWNKKSIKKAPKALKEELGQLAQLNKEQLVFTRPATENSPALAMIWWPWGHGATYSMRIKVLNINYSAEDIANSQASFISKLARHFKTS